MVSSPILELTNLIEGDLKKFQRRFWSKIRIRNSDQCWEWIAAHHSFGYGVFRIGSKAKGTACNAKAHRMAWLLTNGPIPPGLHVLHRCDNPPCCNPAHLYLGNDWANQRDRVTRGRGNTGSKHPAAKLDERQVREIKQRLIDGKMQKEVARDFGISVQAMNGIWKGRVWRHVLWPIPYG